MILSENLDLHEGMENNRNGNSMGKYKHILLIIQNSLRDNQLLKGKVKTMYCGVHGICRSKMLDNSLRSRERKQKQTVVRSYPRH